MIDLQPTNCNLCNGKVVYISNDKIYGKKFGSGFCYFCTECKAFVGTHEPSPKTALGILADKEMRELKKQCHELFDNKWKGKPRKYRNKCYQSLADEMGIPHQECHFGWFDKRLLLKALEILRKKGDKIICMDYGFY